MKTWKQRALTVLPFAVGLPLVAGLGVYLYVLGTMAPLHPDPQAVSSVTHADPPRAWAAAADQSRQAVRAALTEQNLPGVSVAVGVGGNLVWAEGFGWADLEQRVPVAPETLFPIGTASTVLTSAGVGVLLEKEKLTLDDEIQAYVPEFPPKQGPVTLRRLMAHTAGMRTDSGDEGPLFSEQCEKPVAALRFFADSSLLSEPGTAYRFSSYGWILMSAAVEAAAGEPFMRFMRKEVFEPLGMDDTRADSSTSTEPIEKRTTSYFPRFGGDPRYGPDLMRELNISCYSGASALLSTPSDLVRFGMGIQSGKLLQPATVELLQAQQRLPSGQETGYGLGWDLETAEIAGRPTQLVGHDGDSLGGTVASFMTIPTHELVISVISNTSYADTPAITLKIAQAFARPVKK